MTEEKKSFVKGYETNTITTFRNLKGLILDLLRGYPEYEYFGKFESVFAKKGTGERVVEILSKDGLIELSPIKKGEVKRYRLTPTGINLAISLINLEYGERVLNYSQEMRKFTIVIIVFSLLTFGLGALTFYFQFLK